MSGPSLDIEAWLAGLGLGGYAEAFRANDVDGETLAKLTGEDLKEIGVASVGHRRKLLAAIAALGEGSLPVAGPSYEPSGERRQVTVLFADLSNFTGLSSELGAEATHALLNRYFETVDGIVEGYGGTIDKHMGDNVMAVFGAPLAHTDDPERAVRAALDIHAAMDDLSEDLGRPLAAHIGIASGQVVASGTGSAAHREYTVTGDTVNLASRLQDQAKAGETLISDSVRRSTAHSVASASCGRVSVKGFVEEVEVWVVRHLISEPIFDRGTPFLGRRMELSQFTAMLDGVLKHNQGHTLLLRGEPGIGKTRLVEEFDRIAGAQGLSRHRSAILDFGVAKGQDALGVLVASLLSAGPDARSRREAAQLAIDETWVSPDNRPFLHAVLDLPPPPEARELFDAMDSETRKQDTIETIAELIAALSARGPLLLMVEDVHWADRSTLDLLAAIALAVANVPAILVMTSRVEGPALEQEWLAALRGCPSTTIELQPLRSEEALELAMELAGDGLDTLEALVQRAEGNPLFLEHLVQNAVETSDEDLPDTLHGLVLARVDRLGRRDREAVRAASVLGQRFSLEALRFLLDSGDYECAALLRHRVVRPEGSDYLFAHALLRDGVYSSLLRARRHDLHGRAAEYYAGRDSALHAEHLDRAASPDAPRAYLAAAKEEADRVRYENALRLVNRGLEIDSEASRFALQLLQGELLRSLGSVPESIGVYRKALAAAQSEPDRCRALVGVAEGLRLKDDYDELLKTLDRAKALAQARGLAPELARSLQLRGGVHFIRGEFDDCLAANTASLKLAREAHAPELEAQALGGLGEAEFARGRMISAHKHYDRCIELGRKHGFLDVVAANLSMRGQTLEYMNELSAALADCRNAAELARKIRRPRAEMIAGIVAAYIADTNDPIEGETWAKASLQIARRLGARLFESINLEYLGRFAAQTGNRSEGENLIQKALEILRESESGMRFLGGRSCGALALVTQDERDRLAALAEGEALLRGGAPAHNHLWFNRDAMEVCLQMGRWADVETYAKALEDYTSAEPLPWSDFYIARGRALAAFGFGRREEETLLELRRLRDEGEGIGLRHALPALERALASS